MLLKVRADALKALKAVLEAGRVRPLNAFISLFLLSLLAGRRGGGAGGGGGPWLWEGPWEEWSRHLQALAPDGGADTKGVARKLCSKCVHCAQALYFMEGWASQVVEKIAFMPEARDVKANIFLSAQNATA